MYDRVGASPSENLVQRSLQLVSRASVEPFLTWPGCEPGYWRERQRQRELTLVRYLLVGAATAMGAVAIWAMHFIGNRAINMQDGSLALQIGYSPAYSAGSFFLPICFVGVAFYLFTITEQVTVLGIIIGGFLAGFAICGMHYLGQGGISNYHAVYDWRYVLGSAIIAVVAATVALGIFFYFKSGWTNRWWKRIASAALLAVAVSGMHWVATAGTNYVPRPGASMSNQQGLSRRTTVVVVLCLVREQIWRSSPSQHHLTFARPSAAVSL